MQSQTKTQVCPDYEQDKKKEKRKLYIHRQKNKVGQTTSETKSERKEEKICNHGQKIRIGQSTSKTKSEKTKKIYIHRQKIQISQTTRKTKSEKYAIIKDKSGLVSLQERRKGRKQNKQKGGEQKNQALKGVFFCAPPAKNNSRYGTSLSFSAHLCGCTIVQYFSNGNRFSYLQKFATIMGNLGGLPQLLPLLITNSSSSIYYACIR